jgi:VWFA-related protein
VEGTSLVVAIQKTTTDPARKSLPEISSRKNGTTIFLKAVFSASSGESVDFDIQAPRFLNLTISGASPSIDISGIAGVVRVQNSAGLVLAENLTSSASLGTDSGDIVFRANLQPQQDVRLETTSGDITCEIVDDLNLRGMIRAGGKIFWDMDPIIEAASLEKQLGASGPLLYAGSLKGNVVVRVKPGLARKPATPPPSAGAANQSEAPKSEPVHQPAPPAAPDPQPPAQPPTLRRGNVGSSAPGAPQEAQSTGKEGEADHPQPAPDREDRRAAATSQPAQPVTVQGSYDVKVSVDSVFLNASVRDRSSNRSIAGLPKRDFLIYEDGVLQEITQMLPGEAPFNLLLLMDVSGSTQSFLHLMKDAAIDFTRQIKPQDRVAVATFNSNVQLVQGFTNDRAAAERGINRIRSGGGTAFYDALRTCLDRYMSGIEGRSAIIVFTDGIDNRLAGTPSTGSRITFDQLYRRVQESDTIIYTIFLDTESQMQSATRRPSRIPSGWPGGRRGGGFPGSFPLPFPIPQPTPQPTPVPYPRRPADVTAIYEEASQQLQEIAEQTGGRMYTPKRIGELAGVYAEIAADLRIQYLLAYNPTNRAQDGRWREIRAEVENHPEAVVRTRKGYYSRRETSE